MRRNTDYNYVDPVVLGNNLRMERKKRDMHQYAVAKELGLAPNSLSYYEGGKSVPALDLAVRMADLYNVSLDQLLGRDKHNRYETSTMDSIGKTIINLMRIRGITGRRTAAGGFALYVEPNSDLARMLDRYLMHLELIAAAKYCENRSEKTAINKDRDYVLEEVDTLLKLLSFKQIQDMKMSEEEQAKVYLYQQDPMLYESSTNSIVERDGQDDK